MYYKYPRTYHLPWSEGATSDDKVLHDLSSFEGKEVIVTEKLDGENTSMYSDHIHARSLDSKHHESRNYVKALWGSRRHHIHDGIRVCGENVFATHSIRYEQLQDYFYAFSVWHNERCMCWDDTLEFLHLFELIHVPVLYRGVWDEKKIKECWTGTSQVGGEQEGYVVRVVESFDLNDFSKNVAKFVRKNHVQTDDHWMHKKLEINALSV